MAGHQEKALELLVAWDVQGMIALYAEVFKEDVSVERITGIMHTGRLKRPSLFTREQLIESEAYLRKPAGIDRSKEKGAPMNSRTRILETLARCNHEGLTAAMIAERTGLTPHATTGALSALERDYKVMRQRIPSEGRGARFVWKVIVDPNDSRPVRRYCAPKDRLCPNGFGCQEPCAIGRYP